MNENLPFIWRRYYRNEASRPKKCWRRPQGRARNRRLARRCRRCALSGCDLKPTADLRAVMKGILRDHLRADERALAQHVFPDSGTVKSLDGVMA